jgi:hypothetical protein
VLDTLDTVLAEAHDVLVEMGGVEEEYGWLSSCPLIFISALT